MKTAEKSSGRYFSAAFLFLLSISFSACTQSFPEEKISESIGAICREEYGIDHVETKIVGKTVGVYLPLEKIFAADFDEILAGGKVKDIASLLQISPEVLDKVEDVLFSTSRVILSTDKPIDFYVLKATDTQVTGISLVLIGYVQDIKRVRFWDISRTEYRNRVYHDLKVNYPVIWKKPVEGLFGALGVKKTREILDTYFLPGSNLESISPLFYSMILETQLKRDSTYEIKDLRSTGGRAGEALVYAKVHETYTPKPKYADHHFIFPSDFDAEYIFVLAKYLGDYKISRVIPFYFTAEDGSIQKIDFPPELQLYENVEKWHEEFELDEVFLDDFLAQQITRRVQPLLAGDERIQNTFTNSKMIFNYQYLDPEKKGQGGNFTVETDILPKKPDPGLEETSGIQAVLENEDVLYLLDVALRECVTVLRGYWFEEYDYIKFEALMGKDFILKKEDLELYRRKKVSLRDLFERAATGDIV